MDSIRSLMAGLIDYAGLFAPAKLAMPAAAEAYARAKVGAQEWILGRFVCPSARLEELSKAAAALMPGTYATSGYREHADVMEPWRISALLDASAGLDAVHKDLDAIDAFNARHEREENGRAAVDVLEIKVERPEQIDQVLDILPEDLYPYFEPPPSVVIGGDARGFIAALSGEAAGAKLRTGGITREQFPSPVDVAKFLVAAAHARVPFKATAGLHHPVRAEYPLTYEPGCARGLMHGFLNVFVAAVMLKTHQLDEARVRAIIEEEAASAFHFTDEGVRWTGLFAETAHIAKAREVFAVSYGSCSFDEPVEDLGRLGLLG